MHSIKLTHTDLKPENILLVDSSSDPLEVTSVTGSVCGSHYDDMPRNGQTCVTVTWTAIG